MRRAAHRDLAEVGPIDLRLVGREGLQAQESFPHGWTQPGHDTPELDDAAGIAALADHLVKAGGTQPGMLVQGLADELQIGIGEGGAQGRAAVEALGLNGVANGIGVHAQFAGDGADFPMLGVKVAANLSTRFWTNHRFCHRDRGMRGNGSTQ